MRFDNFLRFLASRRLDFQYIQFTSSASVTYFSANSRMLAIHKTASLVLPSVIDSMPFWENSASFRPTHILASTTPHFCMSTCSFLISIFVNWNPCLTLATKSYEIHQGPPSASNLFIHLRSKGCILNTGSKRND